MRNVTQSLSNKPSRIITERSPVERRKNADRSAATRKQILEATVRCLDAWGYGAVTNIKVADQASVSRGAMMHHFPTRQALLVATVEYAYKKLTEYRASELEKVQPGLPRFRRLVDLALVTQRMPEGMACNEIRIGSRSDPEIRAAVTRMMSYISDDYGRLSGRLAREAGLKSNSEVQGLTATTAMAARSLAINTFTYPRGNIVENVQWTLRYMREDIIARQLGEHVAERPEPLDAASPPRKPKKRPN